MNVDFFKDLELIIVERLNAYGYNVPSENELNEQDKAYELNKKNKLYKIQSLTLHFLTVLTRRIPIKKWNIHISPQLKNSVEISNLISMLSNGIDVNSYLSKQVKSLHQNKHNKTDLLLYDWGIYHIHLEKDGKGDDMLFVFFDSDDAYLIDIMSHKKSTWTNTDLVQTLHDNWPHIIEGSIHRIDSDSDINNEARVTIRKKGCNTTLTVSDGTEYLPIGGGFTSNFHPNQASIDTLKLILRIEELEKRVVLDEANIRKALGAPNRKLNLKVMIQDNLEPIVYESYNGKNLALNYNLQKLFS